MFTSLPDTPQGIGDIVGTACRLVRGNLKPIFNFLLVPTIFTMLSGIAFQWILTYGVENVAKTKDIPSALGLGGMALLGTVVAAIAWWVLALRLLALVRLSLGFSQDLEDAKRNLVRKKWSVVAVYLMCVLLMIAAICALSVLGFMAGLVSMINKTIAPLVAVFAIVLFGAGAAFSMCIYMLTTYTALAAISCEEGGAINALGRSLGLVFRYTWRAVGFGAVFLLTVTVLSYPLSLPIAAVTIGDMLSHGLTGANSEGLSGYKAPLWILAGSQVWEAVIGMYLRPLLFFAFGLFYYDLRMRSEGLDIGRRLDLALPLEPVDVER